VPKTERILGYLPLTFLAGSDPSALRAVVGAFGGELQAAENSLAAVMQSHWVDFADSGADAIADLACIGSLYGLLPREDESVEEFREHLKRYVQTFLEGTVTVQGLLRITVETLQLHIEDDYESIDAWWERPDLPVATTLPSGADAAAAIFGIEHARREGADPGPAVVLGPDLRPGVDLRGRELLWLALDGGGTVPIDLTDGQPNPAAVEVGDLANTVNAAIGFDLADVAEGRLRLTSASVGPTARIDVADGPQDAALAVLGLPPRTYEGADATHATVTGSADLSNPTDLTQLRYVRIDVDGNHFAEIDAAAAAADPASTTIDQIAQAIDTALGVAVATHDGQFLTLTSPTPGAAGYIGFLAPGAQDATTLLFGPVASFTFGSDARPATAVGSRDIGLGVDLTENSNMRLAVDGQPAVTVDVAGADPAVTLPGEVVTSLNAGLGDTVAEHDGQFVTLLSPTVGATGVIVLEDVEGDATESILGTPSRSFEGTPPVTAALTGGPDLTGGVDLAARHLVVLSVDDGPAVEVDLHTHASDLRSVSLDQMGAAIDEAFGADVATDDGAHLILVSPTDGAAGSIEILPLVTTTHRRFLSQSLVTDDAGTKVFGFTARKATGTEATSARVVGVNDLLAGLDLREGSHVRIGLDGADAIEADCAGPRPRATTPAEIVDAINAALGSPVASTDGHVIVLVSPTQGGDSAIVLEPTRALDAVDALGLPVGSARGADATGVTFAGVPDLSAGANLAAGAAIAIGVDGAAPIDITVGDVDPVVRNLSQLVGSINATFAAQVASHDGTRLYLTSPSRGAGASIEIAAPTTGVDVTAELLGIGPRTYVGGAATPAQVEGTVDLSAADPLGPHTWLRIGLNGGDPVVIDVAAGAADPEAPTPSEIATAVNVASDAIASIVGGRLRVLSPTTGSAARIEIDYAGVGDARTAIFGDVDFAVVGEPEGPAVLTGEADLLQPVDLQDGSIVRVAVDGQPPIDIDVAGGSRDATVLVEIVAAIDDVLSGVPEATPDDRLSLTSSTAGPASSIELIALRRLEIQEYPPEPSETTTDVAHGTRFTIDNHGAAPTTFGVEIESPAGTVGPKIAAVDTPWSVRIGEAVSPGGHLDIALAGESFVATITDVGGSRAVDPSSFIIDGAPGDALRLARGRNRFVYLECDDARFDAASFNEEHFAGGDCIEIGVFNASRFSDPPEIQTVFADLSHVSPTSRLTARWEEHRAGALVVNLPDHLDERYGVRFGEGRFGSANAELFPGVVTEPFDDSGHILAAVNAGSGLVEAHLATRVPIGWAAVAMPFRDPQPLTLGTSTQEARIFLSEEGLGDDFIELRARFIGTWANAVTVSARQSGPAIYDLEIRYRGGRFENARAIVAGWPPIESVGPPILPCTPPGAPVALSAQETGGGGLPTLASELLAPGPVGVLFAKSAGVHARITRDRVWSKEP
jgi:hypothetical protein